MERHGDQVVVAEGGLDHLRELRRALAEGGVGSEIVAPPAAKCSS
jgi:hypothetical protein